MIAKPAAYISPAQLLQGAMPEYTVLKVQLAQAF
jgi:hypothetical protein